MWGYRKHGLKREFSEMDELIEYLCRLDNETERNLRYWYVEENFDPEDLMHNLADGIYKDCTQRDWLEDALVEIRDRFTDSEWYNWEEETILGIYYREDEEMIE